MKLFVAITEDNDVFALDLDFPYSKQNEYISVHFIGYRECITNEKGEEKAREQLSDEDYWRELGYLTKDTPKILLKHIDFKAVADEVIDSEGWEPTLGDYEGETYSMQNYCSTSEIEGDVKLWLIPKNIVDEIISMNHDGFQKDPEYDKKIRRIQEICDKYSTMSSTQDVLDIFKQIEEMDNGETSGWATWHFNEEYIYFKEKMKKQNMKLKQMLMSWLI
jgi:hypothetical protein